MGYVYSPVTNTFYPLELMDDYVNAGTWPEVNIEVDSQTYYEFTAPPPEGKVRVAGIHGFPTWGDIPPLTAEQLLSQAENKRQSLLKYADEITADWRTELALGEINEVNKRQLSEWMAYKRELKAMDITTALGITWPNQPVT